MKTYTKQIEEPRLAIGYDKHADSPRNNENLGYFITIEKRYQSPDNNEDLKSLIQNAGDEANDVIEHMEKIKVEMEANGYGKVEHITPVYRFEHGNVIYRRGIANGFDYSNCGFYIVTDKTHEAYGSHAKPIEALIDGELEVYTSYVNGEVYEYLLRDTDGEEVDGWRGGFLSLAEIKEDLLANGHKEWKDEDMQNYLID